MELMKNTVYDDQQGGQMSIMNETPLDEELLETKSREKEEGEDEERREKEHLRGKWLLAGGRWLAVDGRWSMGWQLAGGVNLMIPPGTAVRDAHACYEVVVLVTVPD